MQNRYVSAIALATLIVLTLLDSTHAEQPLPGAKAFKPLSRPHPGLVQVEENPKLPRVLLIGDSISMNYTVPVRKLLEGKANVQHPDENCRTSRQIVERLDFYLVKRPWDVIHFNCGIHDLTYLDANKKATPEKEGGKVQVPLDEYRSNLERIVARLQRTGAALVWATTTPLHNPEPYRRSADVDRYNAAAKEVIQAHGIKSNDLNQLFADLGKPMWTPDGVHFTPAGYDELAKAVAGSVDTALAERK